MNAKLVGVLSFVAGALCGAGGMYFLAKKYTEKRIEEEVQDVVDYYRNREERDEEDKPEPEHEEIVEEKPVIKEQRSVKVDANVEPDYEQIIEKLNYNKYSTKVESNDEEPYIISFDQYNNETDIYDKKTVSWFTEDEVLMETDTNEVILDVDKCVGYGNLELFGKSDGGDDDELYVRNEKFGIDYYIVLETGSYANFMASFGEI